MSHLSFATGTLSARNSYSRSRLTSTPLHSTQTSAAQTSAQVLQGLQGPTGPRWRTTSLHTRPSQTLCSWPWKGWRGGKLKWRLKARSSLTNVQSIKNLSSYKLIRAPGGDVLACLSCYVRWEEKWSVTWSPQWVVCVYRRDSESTLWSANYIPPLVGKEYLYLFPLFLAWWIIWVKECSEDSPTSHEFSGDTTEAKVGSEVSRHFRLHEVSLAVLAAVLNPRFKQPTFGKEGEIEAVESKLKDSFAHTCPPSKWWTGSKKSTGRVTQGRTHLSHL